MNGDGKVDLVATHTTRYRLRPAQYHHVRGDHTQLDHAGCTRHRGQARLCRMRLPRRSKRGRHPARGGLFSSTVSVCPLNNLASTLGLVYTPAAGRTAGLASISFHVQDSGGGRRVNRDQTANTITFNVTPVSYAINSAPSGADTTITITENTPYTFSVADFGFTDPNDSPADGFQSVTITALPLDGTLTLNGTPVQAGDSIILPQAGVTGRHARAPELGPYGRLVGGRDATGGRGVRRPALHLDGCRGRPGRRARASGSGYAVASSADGTKLVAASPRLGDERRRLYTSTDAGVTWTARESTRQWTGGRLVGGRDATGGRRPSIAGGEQLYTSTDAGVTWTARESDRGWTSVASSADGMQLVAGALNSQLYTSTDAGVTWTARESNRNLDQWSPRQRTG